MSRYKKIIETAYASTCAHANGFALGDVLADSNGAINAKGWHQDRIACICETLQMFNHPDIENPTFKCLVLHSDGGVKDWMIFCEVATQQILFQRYGWYDPGGFDWFPFKSTEEWAQWLEDIEGLIRADLKLELD